MQAGFFSNQINALKDFYTISLENNLVPFVKEHPHQFRHQYPFSSNSHWQSHPSKNAMKTPEFYNLISSSMPHLQFLSVNHLSNSILDDQFCKLVGTLNGTVGIEVSRKISMY